MTVFVKARSGKRVELDLLSTDTIREVKGKVQATRGVSIDKQYLFLGGKQLEDDQTLGEQSIEQESTLEMRVEQRM